MTPSGLSTGLRNLVNQTRKTDLDEILGLVRTEMARLSGEAVPPVSKVLPARRNWALTPDGFARALSRLAWDALGVRETGMPLAEVVGTLGREIQRIEDESVAATRSSTSSTKASDTKS